MAEQFIYNSDAEKFFYDKLDGFHESYVYQVLLSGVAPKGSDLESIKMTKNPQINKKYYSRVIGGLVNVKPEAVVRLVEDRQTRLECVFTVLNDNELIDNKSFMIQNVMDWPYIDKFSCQVWSLGETSIRQIKKYWNN